MPVIPLAALPLILLGAWLQVDTPDSRAPTPLEQALVEHECGATRVTGAPETDAYQDCLRAQLLAMRTDFGVDLNRLSRSERRTIDTECNNVRALQGRDAYLGCLSSRLTALRNRRRLAHPAPSDSTALPSSSPAVGSADASAADAPAASSVPPLKRRALRSFGWWIGATLVTVLAAGGGVLLSRRARRAPTKCRVCGADVLESGDMCQKCRHEAAEALRRAAAARAEQLVAQEEEQRRQRELHELEEEQHRQKARLEEEARLQQEEEARQREQARQRQEQEEEEARGRSPASAAAQEVFDPYVILGVSRDANREQIEAAYQAAKAKYNVDQVAGMGYEMQEHYRTKAEAIEKAYQMLRE